MAASRATGTRHLRPPGQGGRELERLRHDQRLRRLQPGRPGRPRRPAGDGGDGYVLPGDGKGGFGHRLGPITRLTGVGAISGGGNILGDGAPDLVARTGRRPACPSPHNGTVRHRPPDPDRAEPDVGQHRAQRRRLGPRRLRRHRHPHRRAAACSAAPGRRQGRLRRRRSSSPPASARSGCWPRSAT